MVRKINNLNINCNKMNVFKSVLEVFDECDVTLLTHIHKLLKILITLAITTVSNELSFSTLKRLKTYWKHY